ncbi:hypothetical protein F2Q69_00047595 [Brassica cretica]|uniref:Uncharacterized protein n=1 Tax=Brassica cretica TaxID=69181 RepID=A0A8S9PYT5_BRACR|nr:hypothetical protein F2Q69_00047595 [Brassica cretica]
MGEGEGKALATQTTSLKSTEHEAIRRSDIDALIKALKDNGNSFGNPLGYFLAAYRLPLANDQMHTDYRSYSLSEKSQDGDKRHESEEATNHDHGGGGENPRQMHKKKKSLELMIRVKKKRYMYLKKRNVYLRVRAKRGLKERNKKY